MVERIERIPPEIQLLGFSNGEIFAQVEIERPQSGTGDHATSCISKLERSGMFERRQVEPVVDRHGTLGISNQIGPYVSCGKAVTLIGRSGRRERLSGLGNIDGSEIPTTQNVRERASIHVRTPFPEGQFISA